jgi:hypothetical protein
VEALKNTPPSKVPAPMPLDFVMARVFDLYRELATRELAVNAEPRHALVNEPRKARETAE